ncbi:hypothetical protein Ciccas_011895, partial [Cichlidogyrus casuarinus]
RNRSQLPCPDFGIYSVRNGFSGGTTCDVDFGPIGSVSKDELELYSNSSNHSQLEILETG